MPSQHGTTRPPSEVPAQEPPTPTTPDPHDSGPGDFAPSQADGPAPSPRPPIVDAAAGPRIDALMERASTALVRTDYFEAAALAARALVAARAAHDCDRAARICLPLQEARRQIRQLAVDASLRPPAPGLAPGPRLCSTRDDVQTFAAGCYLFQPPLIAADARSLRAAADRRRIPVFVLTREPRTRAGRWPVCAVSSISVRTQVDPPTPLDRVEGRTAKDDFAGPIPLDWFEAAAEALGDVAIAKLDPDHSPWWHVDELLEALQAIPDHEKLYQRLAEAFRQAEHAPFPIEPRPGPNDNPFCF